MSRYFFFLLLLLGITATANAQEMMLNGSFEDYDGNPDGDLDPSTVSYAAYWRNLLGTCDLVHPDVSVDMSGIPCFGVGAGRFGVPPSSGAAEYFYGRTLPLTAGQIYEVSFWYRKDNMTNVNRSIGMVMTETVPTSSIVSATPLILVTPESTQCKKAKICFTAEHSVTHYLTFGPYNGFGSGESMVYLIDSVSVKTIPAGTLFEESHVTSSKPIYCMGDQVLLDGSASTNETSYEWKIYYENTQIHSSGIINGQAGILNATNLLAFIQPGSCYRAELTTYGVCKDVATVEFCFAEINLDFISDGSPVCENLPVDLQVTGDNGWVYTWNTGQSGVGLKTVTVTPTMGNATYSVTVTTPEGCTRTRSITLNVNSQNNVAPWMDGINGTGEYTYYLSQGDAVFFNSVISNDHMNEQMVVTNSTNLPSGYLALPPTTWGGVFSFSWVTTMATSTGEYYYTLNITDGNTCSEGIAVYKFRIIVVCDQCPVCISYENRTPGGTPLPAETKAGKCIRSGFTEVVSTGDAHVKFIAGKTLDYGDFWDAGPGYEGVIDPTTCLTDCEDCCTDWAGFTYDEIPNPVWLNLQDDDPTNDIFQLTDIYHPFCAYGAKGYRLEILRRNASRDPMNSELGVSTDMCCWFESPAPENPIPHASIWWDGYMTNAYGNQVQAQDGTLTYMIELYGCNGEVLTLHGNIEYRANPDLGLIQNPNGQNADELLNNSLTPAQQEQLEASEVERKRLDQEVSLFPNPTTGIVQISSTKADELHYQVFDDKGVMLSRKEKAVNQSFSLADYSKGTYYIRIYSGTIYVVRKVVKM